ncbi:unnamed protein product [Cylindrotheca closterium]|uniref:Dethiobiotin synthase n=1 Tax=Cylindrotheca closterium TaxID=2856 RepID=A0AAD2FBE0_9STRA|nr:unnamed protein product [Cylindrotheca closterium]
MFARTHSQYWKICSSIRQKRYASGNQTNIIFGANTDVGKTVITAGLIRASGNTSHYVKPLQCGGSDQRFVEKYATNVTSATTLFEWETPASPHYAARVENKPISDEQVITSLKDCLDSLNSPMTWVETAGGVMSPSSSSPDNNGPHHARDKELSWGWVPQADLYQTFSDSMSAVLIGDGRLGGISATLTALESLLIRGYNVSGVIVIEKGYENQKAIQEYASREVDGRTATSTIFRYPESSIVSLPELPPEPEPLDDWYHSEETTKALESFVQVHLNQAWEDCKSAN